MTLVELTSSDFAVSQNGGDAITIVRSDDFSPGALTGDVVVTNPNYNNKPGYIIAHSPYCPHCVNKEPLYKQVADYLTPLGVTVGKLDCSNTANKQACEILGIDGVPSVYTVSNAGTVSSYNGRQDFKSFVDHACKTLGICAALGGAKPFIPSAGGAKRKTTKNKRSKASKTKKRPTKKANNGKRSNTRSKSKRSNRKSSSRTRSKTSARKKSHAKRSRNRSSKSSSKKKA
jgi:hypothetical protein